MKPEEVAALTVTIGFFVTLAVGIFLMEQVGV